MCLKLRTVIDCWHFAVLLGCQREMAEETVDNVIDYISGFSTNVLITTTTCSITLLGFWPNANVQNIGPRPCLSHNDKG